MVTLSLSVLLSLDLICFDIKILKCNSIKLLINDIKLLICLVQEIYIRLVEVIECILNSKNLSYLRLKHHPLTLNLSRKKNVKMVKRTKINKLLIRKVWTTILNDLINLYSLI